MPSITTIGRKLSFLKDTLQDAAKDGGYAIAAWTNGEDDEVYLIAPHGRMLGVGYFEMEINHVDQLASPEHAQWLGHVAGTAQSINEWKIDHPSEIYASKRGVLSDELLSEWAQGIVSTEAVKQIMRRGMEINHSSPACRPSYSSKPIQANVLLEIVEPVSIQVLSKHEGVWGWHEEKLFDVGELLYAEGMGEHFPARIKMEEPCGNHEYFDLQPKLFRLTQQFPASPTRLPRP